MDIMMRRKKSNPKLPPKFNWEFAAYSRQGRRSTMEDAHCIVKNLGGVESDFFIGIFDGHSGDRCSKYVAEHLPVQLVENAMFNKNIEQSFQETFEKVDHDWLEIVESKECDKSKEKNDTWDDGSTAVCLVYKNSVLSVANCGDSRLIVSRKFKDHNPDNVVEKERLEAKQFKVQNKKLGGSLSVSRSFGDYSFKRPVSRGLIVTPDYFEIKSIEEVDFIILACDGLFEECGSNQDIIDSLKEKIETNEKATLDDIAKELCTEAYDLGSGDNVSLVILKKGVKVNPIKISVNKQEKEKKEKAEAEEKKRIKLMEEIREREKADKKKLEKTNKEKKDKDVKDKDKKKEDKEIEDKKKSLSNNQSKSPEKRSALTTSSNIPRDNNGV